MLKPSSLESIGLPFFGRAHIAAAVYLLAACSSGGEPTSSSAQGGAPGASGGSGTSVSGGLSGLGGGSPSSGGAPANGGSPASGGASSGGSATGGTSTMMALGGAGGANNGLGGATTGGMSGASSGGSGNAGGAHNGQGGTSTGGSGAAAGNTGQGGSAQGGMTSGGGACPNNATFCSGFEDSALPTGAVYKLNGDPATPWTHDFEVDATVHHSGNSSLRVRTNTEASGAYKMLAVPAPGAAFWVRFYIRSDVDLGAIDHNVYAAASGSDNPNDSQTTEFAEDVGIAFNDSDQVTWPSGYGRTMSGDTKPFTLAKDTWYCIEISFDGTQRVQMLYIDGMQQINATNFPPQARTYKNFKFGYNALHGTVRKTWYDDVVVAAARVGCM